MKLQDISEIIAGLILKGTLSAEYIQPEKLYPPYDLMVRMIREGATETDVLDQLGIQPVIVARDAASIYKGDANALEIVALLNKAYKREKQIQELTSIVKDLQKGKDLDQTKLVQILEHEENYRGRYITMDEVNESEGITWRKTFYPPLDEHLGEIDNYENSGFPDSGLVVIGGAPGTGKTSLLLKIASLCAANGKKVLLYTLEMTTLQIVKRLLQVSSKTLTKEEKRNIILCEEVLEVSEVYSDAMRLSAVDDIYFIGIDFSDMLIEGVEDEQSMAIVYRTCAKLAKRNKSRAPVILISQLNRNYTGGVPRINHLRYSSLAEAMASLILLVYNPNQIFAAQGRDDRLPAYPQRGYLICGKSRFGYREGSPGAIQLDFDGKESWGMESYGWTPLTSV